MVLDSFLLHIGQNIKKVRRHRHISQVQLALLSGVARDSLSRIENGKHNLTIRSLFRISNALHAPITELLLGI